MSSRAHLHIYVLWSVTQLLSSRGNVYYRCNTHYPTIYWLEVIVSMSWQTVWVRDSERTQWGWLVLSQHVWGPVWEGWKAGADREGRKSSGCSSTHRCGSGAVTTGGARLLPGLHACPCHVASSQGGDLRVVSLLTWLPGLPEKVFQQSWDHIISLSSLRQSSHPLLFKAVRLGKQRPADNLVVMTYLRKILKYSPYRLLSIFIVSLS